MVIIRILRSPSFKKRGFCLYIICSHFIIQFLFSIAIFSQKEAFTYIEADGNILEWNNYPNYWKTGANTKSNYFRYASISDKYGNLLFYFDGTNVFTSKHKPMKGKNIPVKLDSNINIENQPFIIPLGNCKYYIVHDGIYPDGRLSNGLGPFHLVDMNANNGEGELEEIFYSPPNSDRIEGDFYFEFTASTLHANGKDIWLLTSTYENIHSYLIDYETGRVNKMSTYYNKGALFYNKTSNFTISFSPKGDSFFSYIKSFGVAGTGPLHLFDFDNQNGTVSFRYTFPDDSPAFGITFSPSGNNLFFQKSLNNNGLLPDIICRSPFTKSIPNLATPNYCLTYNKDFPNDPKIAYSYWANLDIASPLGFFLINYLLQLSEVNPVERTFPHTVNYSEFLDPESPKPRVKDDVKSFFSRDLTLYPFPAIYTPIFISNFYSPAWVNRPLPSIKAKWKKIARQCAGENIFFNIIDSLPGENIFIKWGDGTDTIINTFRQKLAHNYKKPGKYKINIERREACAKDIFQDSVTILPVPEVKTNPDSAFLCGNQTITASVQNPDNAFQYYWSNTATGKDTQIKEAGTYKIRASNACGWAEDTIVVQESKWEIPNVFTPNNDGMNETWNLNSKTKEKPIVKILNRWGSTVYETESYSNTWDANGIPDGVYFYQVIQNEGCQYKGWVEVLR